MYVTLNEVMLCKVYTPQSLIIWIVSFALLAYAIVIRVSFY